MTAMTTPREIRSPQNGTVPAVDSPAVSARARARITLTERIGKILGKGKSGASSWWAWTSRPLSLKATWSASAVEPGRVPNKSRSLTILWRISNATDRLLIFAVILLAPTAATGGLRWIACRPTRRWGFYLTAITLALTYLLTKD